MQKVCKSHRHCIWLVNPFRSTPVSLDEAIGCWYFFPPKQILHCSHNNAISLHRWENFSVKILHKKTIILSFSFFFFSEIPLYNQTKRKIVVIAWYKDFHGDKDPMNPYWSEPFHCCTRSRCSHHTCKVRLSKGNVRGYHPALAHIVLL